MAYSLLSIIIYIIIHQNKISLADQIESVVCRGAVETNMPLWFLLSLFIVQLMASLFRYTIGVLMCIGVAIPLLGFTFNSHCPYWIYNSCIGLFFYALGLYYREHNIKSHNFCLLSTCSLLLILCTGYPVLDVWTNKIHHGSYYIWFLYMATLSIGIFKYGKYFNSPIVLFHNVGRNSMIIFATHWIVLSIMKSIFNYMTK